MSHTAVHWYGRIPLWACLSILAFALLFTAPIFWSLNMVPDRLAVLIYLNPFTPFVVAYRGLILQSELPSVALFLYITLISVGTAWFGAVLFTKLKQGFADVL